MSRTSLMVGFSTKDALLDSPSSEQTAMRETIPPWLMKRSDLMTNDVTSLLSSLVLRTTPRRAVALRAVPLRGAPRRDATPAQPNTSLITILNTFLLPPPFRVVFKLFRIVSDRFRTVLGPFCDDRAGATTAQETKLRAKNLRAEAAQICCESISDDQARRNERRDGRKTKRFCGLLSQKLR